MCNGNAIMFPQTFRLQYPLAECPTHSYPSAFISRFIVDTLMLSCSANTSLEIRIFFCTNISICFLRSVSFAFFRDSFFVFRGPFFAFRGSCFSLPFIFSLRNPLGVRFPLRFRLTIIPLLRTIRRFRFCHKQFLTKQRIQQSPLHIILILTTHYCRYILQGTRCHTAKLLYHAHLFTP